MWHEARRQEKKIRGMMVDYRKRAERRRNFYEKFKADPTQFLQLHGRPCKIHLDAAVAAAGDASSVMMPWQGQPDLLIDRFDVRAHLDYYEERPLQPVAQDEELSSDERYLNYERYRILVQNDYLGVEEEKFLNQIYLEEQFGPIALKQNNDGLEKEKEKDKRKKGAAIGFTYEDSGEGPSAEVTPSVEEDSDQSDSEDSEFDFDLCLDLSEVDTASAHELNHVGQRFGLVSNDFYSFLTNDVEEQETLRLAKEQEEQKAMYSGRKARRERQAFRERRLAGRVMSPPSYAARQSPVYDKYKSHSKSRSRSVTPDNGGEIQYITSFGGDEAAAAAAENSEKPKPVKKPSPQRRKRSPSRSPEKKRSRSRSLSYNGASRRSPVYNSISARERYRSRSRSRSRDRHRSKSLSRSRSRSHSRPRYRSRSRSSSRRRTRSRSRSRSRTRNASSSRNRPRYRSRKSRSHSRRRSRSDSRSRRKFSRSRSPSRSVNVVPRRPLPPAEKSEPSSSVPRYYGRNRKNSSSSLEVSSDDDTQSSAASSNARNESGRQGPSSTGRNERCDGRPSVKRQPRETPQERMKRRMQALINRQFKQDKRLEKEKEEKAERERQDRAAELRDIAIKIRRRERYLRHLGDDDRRSSSRSSYDSDSRGSPPPRKTLVDY